MRGLKWMPQEGFYVNGKEAYRVLEVASEPYRVPHHALCSVPDG